jgi:ParB-like nuclease domain
MTELKFHPFANTFPLMAGEEFDALVADIRAHGQQTPIVLYEGMILDGRNRYRAARKLEIEPTFADKAYSDRIKDPTAFVISANIRRRHLNAEQKRALIAKLIKVQPEKSDRAIAKMAKVDGKTVAAVRKRKEATAEIPQLKKRTGADGKARPAKKATKPPARTKDTKSAEAAAPTPPTPTPPAAPAVDIDPIKEKLRAAEFKIAGLESEIEELKAENARLQEELEAARAPVEKAAPKKRGRPPKKPPAPPAEVVVEKLPDVVVTAAPDDGAR